MQQHGLGPAQLAGDVAIAHRLAGLLLQRLELALQGDDDVVKPGEIGFGGPEAQLGLMPARMQAGDSGGLFQEPAAIGRLGVDEGADAPLAHHRGRMGAGGGIGEEQLHIAGARFLAVHLIGGAGATIDAPAHLELLEFVEHRRHLAVGIVEHDLDLGDIARGAPRIAGEDDVVHLPAAHTFGRGLAHHPAQRFHQIGFAAAIGADDAGQPRIDHELGGIDEGFEAGEAELGELDQGSGRVSRTGRSERHQDCPSAWSSSFLKSS